MDPYKEAFYEEEQDRLSLARALIRNSDDVDFRFVRWIKSRDFLRAMAEQSFADSVESWLEGENNA